MNTEAKFYPPPISIIIPMFNAEKYIEQCLKSLYDQTFQEFEIIIVDDCSTDKSVNVVTDIAQNFGGKLKLITADKNSGSPGMPRNAALHFAKGKYITFLDSDDFFSKTALEEMYTIAEQTNADVIHSEKYFQLEDDTNNVALITFQNPPFVSEPTLETSTIGERVNKFVNRNFLWWGCNKLFRREFLIENNIVFPNITSWEDMVFAFCCVVAAKNYVRVPNVFYYYRVREESLSHKSVDVVSILNNLIGAIKGLDDFMSRMDYFKQNPQYRYQILDWHSSNRLNQICTFFYQDNGYQEYQVDNLFQQIFPLIDIENKVAFISYLFTIATHYKFLLSQQPQDQDFEIAQLIQKINNMAK